MRTFIDTGQGGIAANTVITIDNTAVTTEALERVRTGGGHLVGNLG